ncbi:MAG: glycosyl hydrolase family 5 [Bacteroides sp. SM23_62]|nr:MAG: glycosyl hydrolase family 5 [Bacteroides sp. SM23_62]
MSCNSIHTDSPSEFVIGKGTNLAHWLSQSRQRGEERRLFIQEKDIEYIAELGFDHVRLPIDEEQMWDEQGNRHKDAFEIMNNCIEWSIKNNLRVIIDLHILRSHHFNAEVKPLWTDPGEQEKFCDLWRDLSSDLRKYPVSMVAYELLNEAVADDAEDWNKLLDKCFAVVREMEPERLIVIGSNRWQSVSTFDELKVPDDKHIILSYHFYEPFLLTHYHASWTGLRDYSGPVHYPGIIITQEEFEALPEDQKDEAKDWIGKAFNKQAITDMMEKAFRKAKELNLPLYCGEFGVLKGAPEEDRLNWYADMMEIFKENNVGSANWNYKSGQFGLVNGDGSKNQDLIEIVAGY